MSIFLEGAEFESTYKPRLAECGNRRSLNRGVSMVGNIASQTTQSWSPTTSSQLDRVLNELTRLLSKGNDEDMLAFQAVGGFGGLAKLFALGNNKNSPISTK